jgi:4-azaleucine resistance transporter AzlC
MVGVAPFGLIYGALAVRLGIPAWAAQAMSSVVFAGSAQFIALPLLATAAPALLVVLTVAVVNLRHLLYSASVAPHVRGLSPGRKMLLAYLLADEAYAVAIARYGAGGDPRAAHRFFLGAGLTLWLTWQASTAAGILVGARVPAGWSLEFALPLTFLALVVPMVRTRAHLAAALVAGAVGLLALGLPWKLGLLLAASAGIGAGMVGEGERR